MVSVTKSWIRLLWRLRCSLQEGKVSGRAAGRKASEEREVRRGDLMDGRSKCLEMEPEPEPGWLAADSVTGQMRHG